jgi:putative transposase
VRERTEAFNQHTQDETTPTATVIHDRDANYRTVFDETLQAAVEPMLNQFCSLNLQAYVERIIQSLQQECTDHFIVRGEPHFDYLVREYVEHYYTERPHQVPVMRGGPQSRTHAPSQIARHRRLGGQLKHYGRAA